MVAAARSYPFCATISSADRGARTAGRVNARRDARGARPPVPIPARGPAPSLGKRSMSAEGCTIRLRAPDACHGLFMPGSGCASRALIRTGGMRPRPPTSPHPVGPDRKGRCDRPPRRRPYPEGANPGPGCAVGLGRDLPGRRTSLPSCPGRGCPGYPQLIHPAHEMPGTSSHSSMESKASGGGDGTGIEPSPPPRRPLSGSKSISSQQLRMFC